MESDCNCPCHFTDDNSENNEDWDSDERERRFLAEVEGMCDHHTCPIECCGYSDDCNCPCHQDDLEAWCRAEREAEARTALDGNSTEKGNSAKESSDDESKS